jgi:hypothetical protein
MAYQAVKTEHAGHKGSARSSGYWGTRHNAKTECSRIRRRVGRKVVREARRLLGV